jgi:hypothetical protein
VQLWNAVANHPSLVAEEKTFVWNACVGVIDRNSDEMQISPNEPKQQLYPYPGKKYNSENE